MKNDKIWKRVPRLDTVRKEEVLTVLGRQEYGRAIRRTVGFAYRSIKTGRVVYEYIVYQ